MSYPSGGPAESPQPVASGSAGPRRPQPNALGAHPVPGQRRNQSVLIGVLVAVVFAVAGLLVFLDVAEATGAGGFAWGLLFSFVPVVPVIALYLWLDRYEPEPAKYILFALGWGVFIATFVALYINTEIGALLQESQGGGSRAAVFVAPPVEEFAKGAVIVLLALIRRKEFDGIIDGLVYAGVVGVGFAFTENILYIGRVFSELSEEAGSAAGLRGAFILFLLRCLMMPFAHPLFTSFTAIGIGIAVRHRSTAVRFLAPVVGYLVAVLAHGLWNAGASWAGAGGFLTVYFVLMVPIFFGMVVFALVMRSREGQMIASRLYDYVRFGWLVPQDVPLIATLRGRKALRQNAKRYGAQAETAAKAFQHTATELAYLRDKMVRQVVGADELSTEKRLLDELRARRPSVPFPPMPAFAQAAPQFAAGPGVPGPIGPGQPPYGGPVGPQYAGQPGPGGPVPGGPVPGGPVPGGPVGGGPQPVGPGGSSPGGYPGGPQGYPSGQPGPGGGYPPGPSGPPGPPGGYGPYSSSQ